MSLLFPVVVVVEQDRLVLELAAVAVVVLQFLQIKPYQQEIQFRLRSEPEELLHLHHLTLFQLVQLELPLLLLILIVQLVLLLVVVEAVPMEILAA
jgi:hypothetical protein